MTTETQPKLTPLANLSRNQLVGLVILIVIIIALSVPAIMYFTRGDDNTFGETWDPDNAQNIRDNINKYNNQINNLNAEKEMLNIYKSSLQDGSEVLKNSRLDSNNFVQTLAKIQPSVIVQYGTAYYSSNDPEQQRRFNDLIYPKISLYSNQFLTLAKSLGYNYYGNEVLVNTDITFRLSKDSIERNMPFAGFNTLFEKEKLQLQRIVDSVFLSRTVGLRLETIDNDLKKIDERLKEAKDKYKENKLDINKYAVLIGIPLFIVAALMMYFYGIRTSNKLRENLVSPNNFDSGDYRTGLSFTLYTITVLLLILSLLILGLAKVIAENALAALLGTIGGYVLNNATDKGKGVTVVQGNQPGGNLPQNPAGPVNPPQPPVV